MPREKKIPHYAVKLEDSEGDRILHESYIGVSVATFEVAFFILANYRFFTVPIADECCLKYKQ